MCETSTHICIFTRFYFLFNVMRIFSLCNSHRMRTCTCSRTHCAHSVSRFSRLSDRGKTATKNRNGDHTRLTRAARVHESSGTMNTRANRAANSTPRYQHQKSNGKHLAREQPTENDDGGEAPTDQGPIALNTTLALLWSLGGDVVWSIGTPRHDHVFRSTKRNGCVA